MLDLRIKNRELLEEKMKLEKDNRILEEKLKLEMDRFKKVLCQEFKRCVKLG